MLELVNSLRLKSIGDLDEALLFKKRDRAELQASDGRISRPFSVFYILRGNERMSRMFDFVTARWNPFVGCNFDCVYCEKSFKRQMKRRKQDCMACYNYEPHFHPERLERSLGENKFYFVSDFGDIFFTTHEQFMRIINKIRLSDPSNKFLFQSKCPNFYSYYLDIFPKNVICGTTIETNRDTPNISNAPRPYYRYLDMKHLSWDNKFVSAEPILDFDLDMFVRWIRDINPIMVAVGYDNWTNHLPEPPLSKTLKLIEELEKFTKVHRKTIRKAWFE